MSTYEEAIEVFGRNHQFMIAMEELAEATQALSKYIRNPSKETAMHIIEEFTDVRLMEWQIRAVLLEEQQLDIEDWEHMHGEKYLKMVSAIEGEREKQLK